MINRGIFDATQYRREEPITTDCFEADIETEIVLNQQEESYVVTPPLFGMILPGLETTQEALFVFPAMNVNVYMDDNLIGTVELPYQTATTETILNIITYRVSEISTQINVEETCTFPEYGIHRVRVEPVENVAGWARGLGYIILGINLGESTEPQSIAALTLIQQPSNRAYYESENNIGEMFKVAQFGGMIIRNQVVVEPIPDDQFSSANGAYYGQFLSARVPRVTITAQNGQNTPEGWRNMSFAGNISQLVIQGKIMDANLTGTTGRWNTLELSVGEYGLHIYVDKDLVDNYKALNETIAPYVFSDEVMPDPPVYVEPGIYHNVELGLITMSNNGYEWITIADKNLGATEVYNDGDTLTEANCGKFYQRGNNYGFSMNGGYPISSVRVDTTGYGDGNYYTSGTFITASQGVDGDWSSPSNDSLWDNEILRGPCPSGFHVTTVGDMETIDRMLGSISWRVLMIPEAGIIDGTTGNYQNNGSALTWSPLSVNSSRPSYARTIDWRNRNWSTENRIYGLPIRPVKDEPVVPDETWIRLY